MEKRIERIAVIDKRIVFAGLLTLLLVCAVQQARATDTKDVRQKVSDALAAIKNYSIDQKDMAVDQARELMDDIDNKIQVWEGETAAHWQEMKDASKDEFAESKDRIRKLRNDLSEWYGGMKHSSKQTWGDVKEGFLESYARVAGAMKKPDGK